MMFLLPFIAKGAVLTDSTTWVKQFMRKVIEVQKLNRVQNFESDAYLKSNLILENIPKTILGKKIQIRSNLKNRQLIWLYETSSKLYSDKNLGFKELVKATKTYGKYPSWDFKSPAQLQVNFADDLVKFEALSDKSFISPLEKNAFKDYNFYLIEKDSFTAKINVVPKHKYAPTFTGNITINIKNYALKDVDLKTTGTKGIDFIDTLQVLQTYKDFKPTHTVLNYNGDFLRFIFTGKSEAIFNNFKTGVNPDSLKTFGKNEIVKDDSSAYHSNKLVKDRSIFLTLQERLSYAYEDSLNQFRKDEIESDSLSGLSKKVRLFPLFFSDLVWKSKSKKNLILFDPIFPAFFYNTVEGAGLSYGVNFLSFSKDGKYWSIKPRVRYGLSNNELNSDVSLSWLYKPKSRGLVNFSAGSTYRDLNPNGTIGTLQNTLNTLFFEQNFMKLYRKEYLSMGIGRELVGNFYLSIGTEISRNYAANNTRDYAFRNIRDRGFSSNNPIAPNFGDKIFPNYTAFFINSSLIYTLRQPYILKDGVKIYKLPLGPRFIVNYRKGVNGIFHSESNYNYLEGEIQHEKLDMGLWGYGSYSVSAGKFLDAKTVYFPEWRHFSGNSALVFNPGLKSFHLLDFYTYSTSRFFMEAHFEHNFNQKFSARIPVIRKLKLEELLGGGYLTQPDRGDYFEAYIGLRRWAFRADYAWSFDKFGLLNQGFRISFAF
ncbi:hypothetical protein A5893_05450 [Pedobacter psychrophilus]|uniref:Carboxypeptidase-like regulatory domain-containing protein n=2 Tax=Pedobacter psychrophilus TaxID=1826909 RepID=A0A179DHM3_9SPHI|nr:hypothetical protein A5893_05450 [Pedobacter psychrophilus]